MKIKEVFNIEQLSNPCVNDIVALGMIERMVDEFIDDEIILLDIKENIDKHIKELSEREIL